MKQTFAILSLFALLSSCSAPDAQDAAGQADSTAVLVDTTAEVTVAVPVADTATADTNSVDSAK